jgi:hypothetical protein
VPDTHVAALLGDSSTRMIHSAFSHVSAGRLLREVADQIDRQAG